MNAPRRHDALEVFRVFLRLGLTSFGGPIAHLGYFRDELVVRRGWIDEARYADLVALCGFLPGPASSQVGFALGLVRAGPMGALAAWCGFTLPSALCLVAVASGAVALPTSVGSGLVHGLGLVAVAVVAQAVWGMARTLTPDRDRRTIAVGAALIVLTVQAPGQIAAILAGGLAGLWLCRSATPATVDPAIARVGRRTGLACLAAWAGLLVGLPLLAAGAPAGGLALFDAVYRAGALVFGGGHVVLPLLQAEFVRPGWVTRDAFLAGYGAAQAMPGPLFTFAAYLGAAMASEPNGVRGALIALVGIFLPGLLLLVAALPFWSAIRARPRASAAMRGANAAVVGILGAALYDPVWTGAVHAPADVAVALAGFALLTIWKTPAWAVVAVTAACGVALGPGGPG